jgi:4-hydroxybenzoate polyprenyltransferase
MNTYPAAAHEPIVPSREQLRTYLRERFPPAVALPACTALAVATSAAAQTSALARGAPLIVDLRVLSSAALACAFLLLLRVFDEHKDAEIDATTRPDRPVQRGVISLRQLRAVGAVAVALQLGLAFTAGWRAGSLYLVPLAYSVAMLVEFGAHRWLGERLLVYAASHMFVMPLLALALIAHAVPHAPWTAATWLVLAAVFAGFFALEITRKLNPPAAELAGVDSYSSTLGPGRGAALAGACLLVSAAAAGAAGWSLGGRLVWIATLAAVTAGALAALWQFARAPTTGASHRLQPLAGLHLLVVLAGLGVVAALAHGVELGAFGHPLRLG